MNKDLKIVLDELAARYNAPGFAEDDPIQFPKRYDDPRDIEISAFLISIISWGRRPMILRNGERMHQLLGNQPYRFVMEGNIDAIPEDNVHRTFFGRHLRYALRGLRTIYRTYGSLEAFGSHEGIQHAEAPAWELAKAINRVSAEADSKCIEPLEGPTRCLPDNVDNSALKRLNMALEAAEAKPALHTPRRTLGQHGPRPRPAQPQGQRPPRRGRAYRSPAPFQPRRPGPLRLRPLRRRRGRNNKAENSNNFKQS